MVPGVSGWRVNRRQSPPSLRPPLFLVWPGQFWPQPQESCRV